MWTDYTETTTETAVRIARACIAGGHPERIEHYLLDHASPQRVECEMALITARPASRTPANTPVMDQLAEACRARFAQMYPNRGGQ